MPEQLAEDAQVAEGYYDSDDADRFYFHIWGGEDIHVGLYTAPDEPIREASRRTVTTMAEKLPPGALDGKILDLGAGYGGSARHLCDGTSGVWRCVNISETQNQLNREKNAAAGLSERIEVVHGSFDTPHAAEGEMDVVWSQDAFLHGSDRRRILELAAHALKPGGHLIFTDPMQADTADTSALQPIFDRIHLPSMGSVAAYRAYARDLGLEEVEIDERPHQLGTHYDRVRQELSARRRELEGKVSPGFADRMIAGLGHWVDGAASGNLNWGILQFRKPG